MKNAILVDFHIEKNWFFLKILGENDWIAEGIETNRLHGSSIKNMLRYFIYFLFTFILVFKRKRYNKIIGWQQFYGLNFAFWSRLFCLKKVNDLTVMTFIYKRKGGLKGKLYHKYMSYIVTSKYIDRFICFAKEECHYYSSIFGVDESKFIYVPLGYSIATDVQISDEEYIFSTGRSNRDYDFLVNSLKNTDFKLIIACDTYHTTSENTENIKFLNDCYGNDMLQLMAKCHCIVVPLKDLKMSSGQLVVIQAMALGKPVVCTKSDGIKDYVEDGVTGFLIDNNKEQLMSALNKLYAQDCLYNKMAMNSLLSYKNKFTEDAMYRRISNAINEK